MNANEFRDKVCGGHWEFDVDYTQRVGGQRHGAAPGPDRALAPTEAQPCVLELRNARGADDFLATTVDIERLAPSLAVYQRLGVIDEP